MNKFLYYPRCIAAIIRHRHPMTNCTWGATLVAIAKMECRPHWLR